MIIALVTAVLAITSCIGTACAYRSRREALIDVYHYRKLWIEAADRAKKLAEMNATLHTTIKNLQTDRDKWRCIALYVNSERNLMRREKQNLLDGISRRQQKISERDKEIADLRAKLSKYDRARGEDGKFTGQK